MSEVCFLWRDDSGSTSHWIQRVLGVPPSNTTMTSSSDSDFIVRRSLTCPGATAPTVHSTAPTVHSTERDAETNRNQVDDDDCPEFAFRVDGKIDDNGADNDSALPFPEFERKSLLVFAQTMRPRSWCLAMITWPYPFRLGVSRDLVICYVNAVRWAPISICRATVVEMNVTRYGYDDIACRMVIPVWRYYCCPGDQYTNTGTRSRHCSLYYACNCLLHCWFFTAWLCARKNVYIIIYIVIYTYHLSKLDALLSYSGQD